MSWKVHDTDDVFAALRGLCSNFYRMYDPSEYRYYYDHECDAYECAVENAAEEYERLLAHCNHQREQLARYEKKVDGMDNIDGGTEIEHIEGSSKVRAGSSITDELREWAGRNLYYKERRDELTAIADRIDEQHRKALERVAAMVDEPDETERRVKALEHLTDGMLLDESELRERVEAIERKLNHRGER